MTIVVPAKRPTPGEQMPRGLWGRCGAAKGMSCEAPTDDAMPASTARVGRG